MTTTTSLISDEVVIQARRLFRENPELHYRKVAQQLSVPILQLENAVRGKTFRHLNDNEPPVIRSVKKEEQKLKAIELYKQGFSYNAIKVELDVSKASLSLWLRDIPKPEKPKVEKIKEPPVIQEAVKISVQKEKIKEQVNKKKVGLRAQAPYEGYKLYTYTLKDGTCVAHLSKPGSKIIITLSRYVMAVHIGRPLRSDELVFHKEGKDDSIDNLVLFTKEEYKKHCDDKRRKPCVICETPFVPRKNDVNTCSRKCTRQYQIQRQQEARLTIIHICSECGGEFTSTSNKPQTCSSQCLNKRKVRLRNEKKPPKIPKPPKVKVPKEVKLKSNVPSKRKTYFNECVVCEQMFYTSLKNKEVCYSQECKDIIDNFEG